MSYRWLAMAAGATILGGAAWYFGRPHKQESAPVEVQANAEPVSQAKGKPAPPKLLEVIDLTSAYDPVSEPTPTPGIDPASYIEVQRAPSRIPYSNERDDAYRSMHQRLKGTPFGAFIPESRGERIEIAPREVLPIGNLLHVPEGMWTRGPMPRLVNNGTTAFVESGLLTFIPNSVTSGDLVFIPMGTSTADAASQPVPSNASIRRTEIKLDVMPREVK